MSAGVLRAPLSPEAGGKLSGRGAAGQEKFDV